MSNPSAASACQNGRPFNPDDQAVRDVRRLWGRCRVLRPGDAASLRRCDRAGEAENLSIRRGAEPAAWLERERGREMEGANLQVLDRWEEGVSLRVQSEAGAFLEAFSERI